MLIQTYNRGAHEAVAYDGTIHSNNIQLGIAIAPIQEGLLLPFACAYQSGDEPMTVPVIRTEKLTESGTFGTYRLVVPHDPEISRATAADHELLNYLITVQMVARGGFANPGEALLLFQSSPLYADLCFWCGVRASIDKLVNKVTELMQSTGFTVSGFRKSAYPPSPWTGSTVEQTLAYRLGWQSGYHCSRRAVLPWMEGSEPESRSMREICAEEFRAYPGWAATEGV